MEHSPDFFLLNYSFFVLVSARKIHMILWAHSFIIISLTLCLVMRAMAEESHLCLRTPFYPLMICPPRTMPSRTLLLGSSCQLLGEDGSVQRRGTGRSESEGRPNLTPTKERTKSIGEGRRSLSRGSDFPKRKG